MDEYESDFEEEEEEEEELAQVGPSTGPNKRGHDLERRLIEANERAEAQALELHELRAELKALRSGRGKGERAGEATPEKKDARLPPRVAAPLRRHTRPAPELCLQDVEIGTQLAGGGFATLHAARWMGVRVAAKRIFDPVISAELQAEFDNEVALLAELRHPNVVALLGAVSAPPTLCLVTELQPRGSLYRALHERAGERWGATEAARAGADAARALQYLHACGVVHRDVKSHNALLTLDGGLKLCDFGLARRTADLRAGPPQGTPAYMAPELWRGEAPSPASDVYALGVLLCEIWSRDVPFEGLAAAEVRERAAGPSAVRPPLPGLARLPPGARGAAWRRTIKACWSEDPLKRPTAAEVAAFAEVDLLKCK